jgi:hypothetical protein
MAEDPNTSGRAEDPEPRHREKTDVPKRTPSQHTQDEAADDETQDDLRIASLRIAS